MHASIASKRDEIAELCERLGVARLDLFGSATTDAFDEAHSDADFVVELSAPSPRSYFDAYFALKERLEDLLGRSVDLLTRPSIENPYLKAEIERTMESIYAA